MVKWWYFLDCVFVKEEHVCVCYVFVESNPYIVLFHFFLFDFFSTLACFWYKACDALYAGPAIIQYYRLLSLNSTITVMKWRCGLIVIAQVYNINQLWFDVINLNNQNMRFEIIKGKGELVLVWYHPLNLIFSTFPYSYREIKEMRTVFWIDKRIVTSL